MKREKALNKNKGFVLFIVLIFMLIISLIGTIAITLSYISYQTSVAEARFYQAEKAANICLVAATERVQSTGLCEQREFTNEDFGLNILGSCKATLTPSGRICFIRAEGTSGLSKVYKTIIIQGFYGAGLYTVRGGVNANYRGGLLTGCDEDNNCTVPAFIASSGTINLGYARPRFCPQTSNTGVWGNPPVYTNAGFVDLTRLFFNVNCFASNFYDENYRCNYGLTDALRDTYGWNYRSSNQPYFFPFPNEQSNNNSSDFYFSPYGEPVINPQLLSDLNNPTQILSQPCTNSTNSTNFDLSTLSIPDTCGNYTLIFSNTVTISGTLFSQKPVTLFLSNGGTLDSINGGTLNNQTSLGEWNYQLNIYSKNPITIKNNLSNVRILTTSNSTISDGATINNSTIIQALESETQNNNFSPQNLIAEGTLHIWDSKIITRHIRFQNGDLYAFRSLLYLYANACPNCVRNTSDPDENPCINGSDTYRCGWYGMYQTWWWWNGRNAYVGMYSNGTYQDLASLIINVNSIVSSGNIYIGGIYFGQDVNYLYSYGTTIRGFLVRNFPPNLSLQIGFNDNTDFRFKLDAINSIRYDQVTGKGFWIVRKVECIRELPSPAYFTVITRMTTW